MSNLAKIRQRECDPAMEAHARQTGEKIIARVDFQRVGVFGQMARRMHGAAGKVDMVRRMADELASAARGLVPCSRGCSRCCHMPTLIIAEEAAVIAAETGARLAQPAQWFSGEDAEASPHKGVSCTFLSNGLCGIYAQRPFACRVHVHIDRDNTLCEIVPGESIRVPRIDTMQFDLHYAQAFGSVMEAKFADVRAFFPQGLAR